MGTSWKLGRIAGIDVFLHPTFLFILCLAPVREYGAYGLGLILAGFACVLLHELGHALMARRFGIGTENITLYPIGGVARLTRMPKAPGVELMIALAGPAVNVAILAGLLAVFGLPANGIIVYLMAVNFMLAAFNLIPAFPMDGGRILRALLSAPLGRLRATAIAAGIGRGLALAFGLYCLYQGLWVQVFLAGFIYLAAGAELAGVMAEDGPRRRDRNDGEGGGGGEWQVPAGYRWVPQGPGRWQLVPIVADWNQGGRPRWR